MNRLRLCAVTALALAACAHDPYEDAHKADTADAYQQFLREHPGEHGADAARARLAELRFTEARHAHTVLGYKRFLEDFPDSEEASDAQKLLEGIRFGAAEKDGSIQAYVDFLRDHPDGAHAAQARTAVESKSWELARAAASAAAMQDFVRRFPDSSHRAEGDRIADDRAFTEASAQGNAGVLNYLDHAPQGAHRDEARALLTAQEAEAVAAGGDLAAAFQLADRVRGPDAAALQLKLAHRELAEVAAALDPTSLRALATRRPVIAQDANELAKKIEHDGQAKSLRAQLPHLDPLEFGRPPDELLHALDATDPRDRWLAAEELGELGSMPAYDKLLDVAADAHFEEIRLRAFAALQVLAGKTGTEAIAVDARRRLDKLRKMASGPRMFLKIAIVEELAGMRTEALADYQRALRGDGEDLLALRRLLELEPPGFERAVFARRLAVTLVELSHAHSTDEGNPSLLAARWFCGAAHDALASQAVLESLPAALLRDAPEDLASFRERAREAVATTHARLADMEDAARAEQKSFRPCDDDDVQPRMEDGLKARLAAVAALAAAKSDLAKYPLQQTAHRDPSARVREAAQRALVPAPVARGG